MWTVSAPWGRAPRRCSASPDATTCRVVYRAIGVERSSGHGPLRMVKAPAARNPSAPFGKLCRRSNSGGRLPGADLCGCAALELLTPPVSIEQNMLVLGPVPEAASAWGNKPPVFDRSNSQTWCMERVPETRGVPGPPLTRVQSWHGNVCRISVKFPNVVVVHFRPLQTTVNGCMDAFLALAGEPLTRDSVQRRLNRVAMPLQMPVPSAKMTPVSCRHGSIRCRTTGCPTLHRL